MKDWNYWINLIIICFNGISGLTLFGRVFLACLWVNYLGFRRNVTKIKILPFVCLVAETM